MRKVWARDGYRETKSELLKQYFKANPSARERLRAQRLNESPEVRQRRESARIKAIQSDASRSKQRAATLRRSGTREWKQMCSTSAKQLWATRRAELLEKIRAGCRRYWSERRPA